MKTRWLVLLLLLVPVAAWASGNAVEASMVVTGAIEVSPDGSVHDYSLDHPDKLPSGIVEIVKATVPHWKFKPVMRDDKPVLAKTQMSQRIVAHPTDDQHATLRVAGAAFGRDTAQGRKSGECANGACLTYDKRQPPSYPVAVIHEHAGGTVYVVVDVDRSGSVTQAGVKQVNLRGEGLWQLGRLRRDLGEAVLKVVHNWTFHVPTTGDEAKKDHWIATVPVNFSINPRPSGSYGYWDAYIPGPTQDIPWTKDETERTASNGGTDAIPDGVVFQADSRFVLLTPIGNAAP